MRVVDFAQSHWCGLDTVGGGRRECNPWELDIERGRACWNDGQAANDVNGAVAIECEWDATLPSDERGGGSGKERLWRH